MSHYFQSLHTAKACASSRQTPHAQFNRQYSAQPEHVIRGQSEFPAHDTDLFFKPFVRARKRSKQNKAWRRVKALAGPILAAVKALGNVPIAELVASRSFSDSQDKYQVLVFLNHHDVIKVDWITKDKAHPGWAHIYRAVDVVQTRVYSVLPSHSNTFGTDLDKSPVRRLLWSECRAWLEMNSDFDETLHLECLQHAVPENQLERAAK